MHRERMIALAERRIREAIRRMENAITDEEVKKAVIIKQVWEDFLKRMEAKDV